MQRKAEEGFPHFYDESDTGNVRSNLGALRCYEGIQFVGNENIGAANAFF